MLSSSTALNEFDSFGGGLYGKPPSPEAPATLCILFLCVSFYFFYTAKNDARIAPHQRTAAAALLDQGSRSRFYRFTVKGAVYAGEGSPELIAPDNLGDPVQGLIYYDLENPELNSPIDFHRAAAANYSYSSFYLVVSAIYALLACFQVRHLRIWRAHVASASKPYYP